MPGRTVMSPHRRHAITLRRLKVFIAQIKQNQVTWVGEAAPGDDNLLIKTKCNSLFFCRAKTQTNSPACLRNTDGYSGNSGCWLSSARNGIVLESALYGGLLQLNAGSCSTFGGQISSSF